MQRIHFTTQDLLNLRVASRPWPMVEAVFALQRLQDNTAKVVFDQWRRDVRATLRSADRGQEVLQRMFSLVTPKGFVPDFFCTVAGGSGDIDGWIDHVLAAPRTQVRADLEEGANKGWHPGQWVEGLALGDRESRSSLAYAMRSFISTAIEPQWKPLVGAVEADRAARARDLLDGGLGRLFAGLPGVVQWDPPTLMARCPRSRDVFLDGRGVVLVPSFFCWSEPVILFDAELPPVLVYPMRHHLTLAEPTRNASTPLTAALGRTRSVILELIAEGATTGELARRLGLSPATASWHVSALREAGLITTVRNRYAIHTLTVRGEQLLVPSDAQIRFVSNSLPGLDP